MRFLRETIEFDAHPDAPVEPGCLLQAGRWTIEADRRAPPLCPPVAHHPGRLLGSQPFACGLAFSLRTPTLLRLDISTALVGWLAAAGHAIAPLAGVALHEILVNAAVHGNLGVASGPSTCWNDLEARNSTITAALQNPALAGRCVTVALRCGDGEVMVAIADEGAGYRRPVAAPARGARLRASGNGLRIAREAGKVTVERGGRCTTLTLRCLDTHATEAAAAPISLVAG